MVASAEDCRALARAFHDLAQALGDYRFDHFDELTTDERGRLAALQNQLIHYSNDLTADAIAQTLASIQVDGQQLQTATTKLKEAADKIATFGKIVRIGAAAVALGASIAAGNPEGIVGAVGNLKTAIVG